MISVNNFMMFIVITGLALCCAYLRAQFRDWHRQTTADLKERGRIRLLYQVESSRPQESVVVRVVDLAGSCVSKSPEYGRAQSRSVYSDILVSPW